MLANIGDGTAVHLEPILIASVHIETAAGPTGLENS